MYVTVIALPEPVQSALKSVGYARKDIEVRASETVTLSGAGSAGTRSFATLINLTTGTHRTEFGSWGGSNMFTRTAVDDDHRSYPLPDNGCAVTGSTGASRPVYAVLHIPAVMWSRMLPASADPLTTVERDALYCHHSIKGGAYRRDELQRRKVPAEAIDRMIDRGYLKRNRAGAVSITTDGKNALGNYRGY